MIISKDINPVRDVYYLGAKIIEIIAGEPNHIEFLTYIKKFTHVNKFQWIFTV
jgi:hypothetical protein